MEACGSGTSVAKTKRMQGFTALLISAACEWFLILLLLLDAVLSYALTKFASYCQLQLPCLLCSRLDPILGCEKPEFYQNLFCSNHKSEISSLIFCHVHGKLANGHRMCDDCLLSVTANTKSNSKTHRLLVGKFGLILGGSGSQSPSLSRDLFTGSGGSRPCTCCCKLWKSEQNSPRSIQLKSRAVLKPCIPLPYAPRQSRLNHWDNMQKMREKFSGLEGKKSFNPLTNIGYTELKFTSDSESEFPFSDDDDVSSVFHENFEDINDAITQITSMPSSKCIPSDFIPAKPNGSSAKPTPLPSDQCVEPNVSKHQDVNGNHPVEINLQQANEKSLRSDPTEHISLDEVSTSHIVMNVSNGESESKDDKIALNSLPAILSELMTSNSTDAHVGASSEKSADVAQTSDTGGISEKNEEVSEEIDTREKASTEADLMVCDSAPINPSQENIGNMDKSCVTTKEREVPGFVIEQPTTEEVDKVKEEVEQSPSHSSSLYGSNMSSVHSPEIHAEDSISNGIQVLRKSASVGSGLESLDESIITEIQGESNVNRLSRQIEYYKKCMDSLQKELEEERNASAIATNEAMSMITRLQEEKASLQMEALQYLRMMEEQAEYDNDELEKINALLTEKEKEVQDLEAELEYYRSNLTGEPMVYTEASWEPKGENIMLQNTGVHNITNTVSNFSNSQSSEKSKVSGDEAVTARTLLLEFEEEKLYISQCLKNLETKLHQISCDEPSSHTLEVSKSNQQGASNGEGPQLDGHEETDMSIQKNIDVSNGNHNDKDGSSALDGDDCSVSIENHSTASQPQTSLPRREVEFVTLENEISDIHDRLEALEFDHDLLGHIINSLQSGNDGKQFIQDIAHRLHELRKIGMR